MPRILIGNVKGPQGEKGDTGATGAPGEAASVRVGTVETVAYGQPAAVTNTGTDYDAVFNFRIPQGAPGQAPTGMGNLLLDSMTESTAEYPVIAVDERGSTVFGKIKKFLNDLLSAVTSINTNGLFKSNLVNGFTQTTAGVNALDAAAGKSLNDSFANYLPTTDIAATYATKSETLRANIIRTSVASGKTLAAGDWKDYDTGVTITGTIVAYIAQYSGNPKCVIANMWTSATNTANVTIYNPSSAAQTLSEIRILELYRN